MTEHQRTLSACAYVNNDRYDLKRVNYNTGKQNMDMGPMDSFGMFML